MIPGALIFQNKPLGLIEALLDGKPIGMIIPYDGPGKNTVCWLVRIDGECKAWKFAVDALAARAAMTRVVLDHLFALKQEKKTRVLSIRGAA